MKKNILVIEDDKDSREILKIYLNKWDFQVFEASSSVRAFEILRNNYIHIALVDWVLTGLSGIDICKQIRNSPFSHYLYIIIITGKKTRDDAIEALSNGADDYIMKPFNFEELKVRIDAGLRIIKFQEKLKSNLETMHKDSQIDFLTGVYNRKFIMEKLEIEFGRAKRTDSELSIILCDIDYFKRINDEFGHLAGDEVLSNVGGIFTSNLRKYDYVGRYGGEEFLLLLPDSNIESAKLISERIRKQVENTYFRFKGKKVNITLSFGISSSKFVPTARELIELADKALYNAKHRGRNRITVAASSGKFSTLFFN